MPRPTDVKVIDLMLKIPINMLVGVPGPRICEILPVPVGSE